MSEHAAPESAQPPWTAPTGVLQVVDLQAAEHHWEISPGVVVHGYAFNGQAPGPVIEASVGDTLLVRFTNLLPEPTTIHWHGLRVPAAMDGSELAGDPVPPGGHFQYRFDLPDAGTFWYHSHLNETVQLERGLYGAIVVRNPDDPPVDGERVLLFDDLKMNRRGQIAAPTPLLENMRGREGDVLLINGVREPTMQIPAGQIERWRLINTASARHLRLSLSGHRFHVIGTDGGLIPAPYAVDEVLMAPGDRFDLAVGPFTDGETVVLQALPYDRGAGRPRHRTLATLHVAPEDRASTTAGVDLGRFSRAILPLVEPGEAPTRTIRLGGRLTRRGVEGTVNDTPHFEDAPVHVGRLQVWDIVNETTMDHPFHLHGFFFQILSINGEPPSYPSWEDTVNVRARGRVRIAWLPDNRPGPWMYHCHILEHHAVGMMAHFDVVA